MVLYMRSTHALREVLATFGHPGDQRFGLDIMRRTGLASGTVYPILHRLEQNGYVTSGWETTDPAQLGRPPRRWYQLTAAAQELMQDA